MVLTSSAFFGDCSKLTFQWSTLSFGFLLKQSCVTESAIGTGCAELGCESQEGRTELIPTAVSASAGGKTGQNIKWSPTGPIKSTKSAVMVRREPGARCESTQNTGHRPFGLLGCQCCCCGNTRISFRFFLGARVALLTFSLTAKPQFLLKLWMVGNPLHSTPWQTISKVIPQPEWFF